MFSTLPCEDVVERLLAERVGKFRAFCWDEDFGRFEVRNFQRVLHRGLVDELELVGLFKFQRGSPTKFRLRCRQYSRRNIRSAFSSVDDGQLRQLLGRLTRRLGDGGLVDRRVDRFRPPKEGASLRGSQSDKTGAYKRSART